MPEIVFIMGKSASGKDKIYKALMEDESLNLSTVTLYTTRPMRVGETEGVEYHFVDDAAAQAMVDAVADWGGNMTMEDLANYEVEVMEPVHGTYRGYDIYSSPSPSSGGTIVLDIAGQERAEMTPEKLLKVFHQQGISNDRIELSAE